MGEPRRIAGDSNPSRWQFAYPANNLGGAGVHWSGAYYRWDPVEFKLRSHYTQRYGARIFEDGITAQDWPLTYDELEPYFDRFDYLVGASGFAGNLKGAIQPGGNPFEPWRSRPRSASQLLRGKVDPGHQCRRRRGFSERSSPLPALGGVVSTSC